MVLAYFLLSYNQPFDFKFSHQTSHFHSVLFWIGVHFLIPGGAVSSDGHALRSVYARLKWGSFVGLENAIFKWENKNTCLTQHAHRLVTMVWRCEK